MRKTSSFHLEEDIFNEIVMYQKQHNLSSRNIALERMILEMKSLRKELEDKNTLIEFIKSGSFSIQSIAPKTTNGAEETKVEDPKPKNKKLGRSIKSAFDSMPEGNEDEE